MNSTESSKSSQIFQRFHQRIREKSLDNSLQSIIIVALGDSVTAGMGRDTFLHEDVYHAQLKRLLQQKHPQSIFSVINAGANGQDAVGGLARFERDIPHHQPDLVLIGYGLNDCLGGLKNLANYEKALNDIIELARATTEADLILLTPNMMPRYATPAIPAQWQHLTQQFIHLQNEGIPAAYASCVREVGRKLDVAVADIYAAWEELENQGIDSTLMLANGLNHPDAWGHRIAAEVIFRLVELETSVNK